MNEIAELFRAAPSGFEARLQARPETGSGEFQAALARARHALKRQETAPEERTDGGRAEAAPDAGESSDPAEHRKVREGASPDASEEAGGSSANGATQADGHSVNPSAAASVALASTEQLGTEPPVVVDGSTSLASDSEGAVSLAQPGSHLLGDEVGTRVAQGDAARSGPGQGTVPAPQPQPDAVLAEGASGVATRPNSNSGSPGEGSPANAAPPALASRGPQGESVRFALAQDATAAGSSQRRASADVRGASTQGAPNASLARAEGRAPGFDPSLGSGNAAAGDEALLELELHAATPKPDASGAKPGVLNEEAATGLRSESEGGGRAEGPVEAGAGLRAANESSAAPVRGAALEAMPRESATSGDVATASRSFSSAEPLFDGARFASVTRPSLQQMVRSAEAQIGEDVSTLRLQLKPTNLGELDLRLSVEHGVLTAKFVAQSLEVKALIESALPDLRQSLNQQGVAVEQLTVSVGDQRDGGSGSYDGESGSSRSRGYGSRSGNPVEAVGAGTRGSSTRMWYSQGVDVLV